MSAKTVQAPGLLGDLLGPSASWLLDGPALLLLTAVLAASYYAALMARRS